MAKENVFFRDLLRKIMNFYRLLRFKIETFGTKVNDKMVIFSCFNGASYTCSPKAIYEYMLKDERFKDYTFQHIQLTTYALLHIKIITY